MKVIRKVWPLETGLPLLPSEGKGGEGLHQDEKGEDRKAGACVFRELWTTEGLFMCFQNWLEAFLFPATPPATLHS